MLPQKTEVSYQLSQPDYVVNNWSGKDFTSNQHHLVFSEIESNTYET